MNWLNLMKRYLKKNSWAGVTLPELLIALAMGFIIIMVLFSSISAVNGMIKRSETETERRIELSRAFDFMTNEIRSAKRVNHTATSAVDGGTTTLINIVSSSGINLANLGSYGTLVLYLEVPFSSPPPTICPAGTPRAGSPPPASDVDQVVYDIRPNPTTWLGPRVISRYGRIPKTDGTIDPCTNPVGSDILVDSISDLAPSPTPVCSAPASLSGSAGFMACVKGGLVDLYLKSQVINLQTQDVTSKAFSASSSGGTLVAPVLSGAAIAGNQMNFSWTWGGSSSPTYKLYQSVNGGTRSEIYSGAGLTLTSSLLGTPGSLNCYTVVATVGTYTSAESNTICQSR
jgi:hypothetical protein